MGSRVGTVSALDKSAWSGCILLCVMLWIQPVLAQSNTQGLTWGFAAGDEFQYVWTVYDNWSMFPAVSDWSERIRVEIESLPTIPVSVESLNDITFEYTSVHAYFANGTEITGAAPWTALPIGNWTLMAELLLEALQPSPSQNVSVLLTSAACVVEMNSTDPWGYYSSGTIEFLLSDGVLSHYYYMAQNMYAEQWLVSTMEVVRMLPSGAPVLVTAMLGAAMVVAILAIEFRRRRRKR